MPTVDQRKTRGSAVDRDRGVTVGRAGISCFVEKFSDSDMNATSGTFTTSPLFGSLIGAGAGISGERLLAASGGLCRPLRNGLRDFGVPMNDPNRTAFVDRYGCLFLTASIILIATAIVLAYIL